VTTRYLYSARLVPLGAKVRGVTYDARAFSTLTRPINVCVNHDRELVVGEVGVLYHDREGWHCCDFTIDPTIPDVDIEVGQPISAGLDIMVHGDNPGAPFLREVSLVPRGAVKGAEVFARGVIPPAPTASPTAVSASNRAAVGGGLSDYRPPVWAELERVVGYRITDENQERAFVEASKTAAQRHYDEHMAVRERAAYVGSLRV
jgi:hypothetical protein